MSEKELIELDIPENDFDGFCKLTGNLDNLLTKEIDVIWSGDYKACKKFMFKLDINPHVSFDILCNPKLTPNIKTIDDWDLNLFCEFIPRDSNKEGRKYHCFRSGCKEHPDGGYTFEECQEACEANIAGVGTLRSTIDLEEPDVDQPVFSNDVIGALLCFSIIVILIVLGIVVYRR